jgi:hypothetical protein
MARRMLFLSSFTDDAACGLSTSTPVSSTKVVVTMKNSRRMKMQSISGEMSIPASASSLSELRKRLMSWSPRLVQAAGAAVASRW